MSGKNGCLEISVSKGDFLKKPTKECLWILLQSQLFIQQNGCNWERKRWKKVVVMALGLGALTGFIGGLLHTEGVLRWIFH